MATYDIDNLPSKLAIGDIVNCPYKGSVKSITLPKGTYKLECWGAKGGGNANVYGGYSVGIYGITEPTDIFLASGGVGVTGNVKSQDGAFNGGGDINNSSSASGSRGGGGATHIALETGLLSTFENKTDKIIMVAGGAGGTGFYDGSTVKGGAGGGTSGGNGSSQGYSSTVGRGASQTAGGSGNSRGTFGKGGYGRTTFSSGAGGGSGGGGFYGGGGALGSGQLIGHGGAGGGGGSGYVNTSLLINASTTQQSSSTNPDTTSYAGYIRITVQEIHYGLKFLVRYNRQIIIPEMETETETAPIVYNGSTIATLKTPIGFTQGALYQGSIIEEAGWVTTDYISVPSGCTSVTIEHGGVSGSHDCLDEFGANKGYLSYWGAGENPRTFNFDYPNEIKYIRATFYEENLKDCYVKDETHNTYIISKDDFRSSVNIKCKGEKARSNITVGGKTIKSNGKVFKDDIYIGKRNWATITVSAPIGSLVYIQKGTTRVDAIEQSGIWQFEVNELGVWNIHTENAYGSKVDTVDIQEFDDYQKTIEYAHLTVTAPTGSTVYIQKGSTRIDAAESSGTWIFNIGELGTWTVYASKSGESASSDIAITSYTNYTLTLAYSQVFGVEWDGSSTTVWSRTDDASGFTNPSPAVSNGSGSSPFDNILPWSGMVVETNSAAGQVVKIPKYWYKWTKNGNKLKLQISNGARDGFYVSPAHADRGDGKGERDFVYVGRYHCGASAYKSVSGQKPKVSITRSTARTQIHNLGSTIWQWDFAMLQTIQMLYLVEFGDWNSQTKIGYGCGNNSAVENMGGSDASPYHTGTKQSSRTTYGVGTQYRHIEDLWGNCYDWLDGCYYNSDGLNLINNPSRFSDSSNGTLLGNPGSSGYIKSFNVGTFNNRQFIYMGTSGGSDSTYCPDYWYFNSSKPCLNVGGGYSQSLERGLFYVDNDLASDSYDRVGCRLMMLP